MFIYDRSGWTDRSVELPVFNGYLETGSGSCQRMLYGI